VFFIFIYVKGVTTAKSSEHNYEMGLCLARVFILKLMFN
jgi:hypothetical protein